MTFVFSVYHFVAVAPAFVIQQGPLGEVPIIGNVAFADLHRFFIVSWIVLTTQNTQTGEGGVGDGEGDGEGDGLGDGDGLGEGDGDGDGETPGDGDGLELGGTAPMTTHSTAGSKKHRKTGRDCRARAVAVQRCMYEH
jgi:hypothetical protein